MFFCGLNETFETLIQTRRELICPFEFLFPLIYCFRGFDSIHSFFMFVYHKYHLVERLFPNGVKSGNRERERERERERVVKPTVHIPEDYHVALPALQQKIGHHFRFFKQNASASNKSDITMAHSVIVSSPTGVLLQFLVILNTSDNNFLIINLVTHFKSFLRKLMCSQALN